MKIFNFFSELLKQKKPIFFIDSLESWKLLISSLKNQKEIGIDTEFDWRTTYLPKLCTIQISTKKKIFILDCMALSNFRELKSILESKSVLKIFHSVRSDSTVLSKCLNIFVNNVFDIQQAEKEITNGEVSNYGQIVKKYLNVSIEKGETNSNWLKRPLTKNQMKYAAEDVDFLIKIYHIQKKILSVRKFENVFKNSNLELELGKESLVKLRLKKRKKRYSKKEQNIFLWRERIAETENIPPNHVFQEKHISFLANSFSNEHPKLRSKLLKIIGDSKYVEEFIVKFL